MTDHDADRAPPAVTPAAAPAVIPPPQTPTPRGQDDMWERWKWRLVNLVGLFLLVREAFLSRDVEHGGPSLPILLVGLALVLGAAGVQLLLRGGGK